MMTKLLRRMLGRPRFSSEPITQPNLQAAGLEASPATILAIDPPTLDINAIDVDSLYFPWLLGTGEGMVQSLNEGESRILRALKRAADTDDPTIVALVPRMPSVIPMLLQSLRERDVSNNRLAEQISRDAVLVAAVLKQVNSAYFQRSGQVTGIEEALTILGQNGLRILVASVAFKPLFNLRLGYFTNLAAPRLWELSTQYEIACRYFAGRKHVDGFEAFLAGLLQNVGVVVALRVMDQAHLPQEDKIQSLAYFTHFAHYARRLAQRVGQQWEFPEQVIAAIRVNTAVSGHAASAKLAEVLRLADKVTKLRLLVNQAYLQEEDIEACLDGDDVASCMACYRQLANAQATQADS